MEKRLQLQQELEEILGTDNVYFQPPENVKLSYPCIIYAKASPRLQRADNRVYRYTQRYDVTVIYDDPDMDLSQRLVSHFPMCTLDRPYKADNLYHDSITLYY